MSELRNCRAYEHTRLDHHRRLPAGRGGPGRRGRLLRRKGERGGEGGHYFLAGNTLGWAVIGLAMFAANISTVHLVSLAEAAYKFGLVFGNFEWMAGFTLILLSLFFAPLYLRSRVATLPDFLERRFNRPCRDVLSVVSLFSAIVIHMGVALYTAAWVLRGILGLPPGATILGVDALMFFIIVLGVLTGIYTMLGGLLAVVWTESVQTVLLLVGAVVITVVGYLKIGGWSELAQTLATHPHPLAGVAGQQSHLGHRQLPPHGPRRRRSFRPGLVFHPARLPGAGHLVLVLRPDHRPARAGGQGREARPARPAVLRVPEDLAGVLLRAARRDLRGAGPAERLRRRRRRKPPPTPTPSCITHLLPVGLKGLVAAAMLAAAMQTCSAALNSTATLVAYDLFKRHNPASATTSW